MKFLLFLFSTLSLVLPTIFCSTLTVTCDTKSQVVSKIFKEDMQGMLDHSTDIWQCYKDHLKVDDRLGYEECINQIDMNKFCRIGCQALTKESFNSRNRWVTFLEILSVSLCKELNEDPNLNEAQDLSPSSVNVIVTGGNFDHDIFKPEPWSAKSIIVVISVILISIAVFAVYMYYEIRKSEGKQPNSV